MLNVNIDQVQSSQFEVLLGQMLQLLSLLLRIRLFPTQSLECLDQLFIQLLHVLLGDIVHVDVTILALAFLCVISEGLSDFLQSILFQFFGLRKLKQRQKDMQMRMMLQGGERGGRTKIVN